MKRMTLSIKFTVMYILVLVGSLVLNIILYDFVYTREYEKQILESSSQTLYSIDSTLNSLVSEVSIFSTSVLGNQNLQAMIKENNIQYNMKNDLLLEKLLFNLSLSTKKISSIGLFDLNGRSYKYFCVNEKYPFYQEDYQKYEWYQWVKSKRGGAFFRKHTGFLPNEYREQHKM